MRIRYLAALAAATISTPTLAQTIYFGENLSPGAAVSGAPLTARNNFAGQLTGASTEDFSGFAAGSNPPTLTFTGSAGPINGTFTGSTGQICVVNGCGGAGRFATSAVAYFDVSSTIGLSFSTPIAAFGFYGTDIGDFNGQLILTLIRNGGTNTVLNVPHTLNAANGSLLFFGVIDTANPFDAIQFSNTLSGTDFFGFDDMIVGDVRQVTGGIPEPSTWAMLILGFGAVGATLRRRQRQVARVSFA
jgi:hypothetical protein